MKNERRETMNGEALSHLTAPGLKALSGQLDALARADGEREGLEGRVVSASLPMLEASVQVARPTLRLADQPLWWRAPLRVAAGVAIVATAGLTWMAMRLPQVSTNLKHQVAAKANTTTTLVADDWAASAMLLEEHSGAGLDELLSTATTLEEKLRTFESSDVLEEGAM